MGVNHRIIKSDDQAPEFFEKLWKTISNGQVWHGEVKNITRSGRAYWLSATIVPFVNEDGEPFQYISIRTDITKEKLIEIELERALQKAESATRAKSDFLANMSHEIIDLRI